MIHEHLFAYQFETVDIFTVIALIFLEGVLSFDNAAVLAALVRKLPVEERRKALLYGLVGAYAMRIVAIFAAVFIISNPILKVLGGLYLVYLAVKHFVAHVTPKDPSERKVDTILGLSAFWSTIVYVELTDLAFAIDQVVATVAYVASPDKILLVVVASMAAILLLRISALYMGRLMDWLPSLEHVAYGVVGFVGAKLVLEYFAADFVHHYLPKAVTSTVTIGAFVVPVGWKMMKDRRNKSVEVIEPPAQEP